MIKKEMKKRGWEVKDLAAATKLSAQHLYRVLDGRDAISATVAKKLGKALGLDAQELYLSDAKKRFRDACGLRGDI